MSQSGSQWLVNTHPRPQCKVRLVCFPHGGGGPAAYRDWAERLPEWIEVVAVSPPGRGARHRENAIDDLTAMAESIADAIGSLDDRPLCLFGHSVGALVAGEVARELELRQGASPMRVIVSGFAAPGAAIDAPHRRWDDISDDDLLAFLADLGHAAQAEAMADPDLKAMMLSAVRADFRMAENARSLDPLSLRTPLTVFGGTEDSGVPEEGLRAWRHHGAVDDVRLFPGGHFFTETCAPQVLEALTETLAADLDALPRSLAFGPVADYPREATLDTLFRVAAGRTPDAPALVDGGTVTSFAELDALSDLLARRLLAQGIAPGKLTAIFMETSAAYVIALIAALKAGGGYLPIPAATPPAAVADILEAAGPAALVASPALAARLPEAWRDADRATILSPDWRAEVGNQPLGDLATAPRSSPDDVAYCVMTSGTTGRPKGILCPHRGAVNSYFWRYRHMPYAGDEREACNVFFVWEVLRPLFAGRPAVIIPDEVIFDPRRLVAHLSETRATRVLFTPSLLDQILEAEGPELQKKLTRLRAVVLNGEVVTTALVERFARLLPQTELWNDYSISECHDVTTMCLAGPGRAIDGGRRYAPVGTAMDNVSLYVLDALGAPVPQGTPGEVYVGGDNIALGYLNAPDETALRFLPDPFAQKSDACAGRAPRMFRTGDVGRLTSAGSLEISGRSHFMVKIRGYSVVPSAVEAELRAHPAVSAALVVPVDDPHTGQPDRLCAYVAGEGGEPGEAEVEELRGYLRGRLPHYAIPGDYIPLAALPIDPTTGKVDRRRLPTPPAMPARLLEANGLASASNGPTTNAPLSNRPAAVSGVTTIIEQLAGLWQRLLGRLPQADDNFFDLGGHSLLAAEMTRLVETTFDIRLNVIDVFDHPTLAAYATLIAARCDETADRHAVGGSFATQHGPAERAARSDRSERTDIAVVGMAGRFPGADNLDAFWDLIVSGRSALRQFSEDELRRRGVSQDLLKRSDYIHVGAVIDNVAEFDPRFWGLSEAEATVMDPQQRLFLECCWHALEAAGHTPSDAGGDIGVFAGAYLPGYLVHHLGARSHLDPAQPPRFHLAEIGNDKDYLASRAAFLMNLTGPAVGVQTSCSTGLVAIAQAVSALRDGQCRMALAGAASISFPQGGFVSADGHIGASSGVCRAFDAEADGTILGDGIGVVVLRPLVDAVADGDEVLAVVKGAAINNDGAAKAGYSAPSSAGQSAVIRKALDNAGISADTIGYLEAHGTGTRLGDPIEIRGASEAFRRDTDRRGYCALGSVKPNLGHSNIAAGVAGFMKAVMAVRTGTIPPLANFRTENPALDLAATPFAIPREARAWNAPETHPRRAGVSSFGIGGTNCHIVIEGAPVLAPVEAASDPGDAPVLLPISAKTPVAVEALSARLADWLETQPSVPLADVAATLQSGRVAFRYRSAVVADTHVAAVEKLRGCRVSAPAVIAEAGPGPVPVAFVFPGHGAQYPGMGLDLYSRCALFRRHFDSVAAYFQTYAPDGGAPVPLIERLRRAENAPETLTPDVVQPGLFAIQVAMARTLIEVGVNPAACCGHSLGEYAAAVVAGTLSDRDATRLVAARAAATATAPQGGMLSLAAGEPVVRRLLAAVSGLALAAENSPRDCVVSGERRSIAAATRWAEAQGIAAKELPVDVAFHSPLMDEAAASLHDAARDIAMRPPAVPLASNLEGGWWPTDAGRSGDYWVRQMLAPVRFADNIAALAGRGVRAVLELGPGRSLLRPLKAGLERGDEDSAAGHPRGTPVIVSAGRISQTAHSNVRSEPATETDAFLSAIGRLWQLGAPIDWHRLRDGRPARRIALPGYPFVRVRCWPEDDVAAASRSEKASLGTAATVETRVPFARMFHQSSWHRVPPQLSRAATDAAIYVVIAPQAGPAAVCGERLRDLLKEAGCEVALVRSDDDPNAHWTAIRNALTSLADHLDAPGSPPPAPRIVDLSFLSPPPRSEGRAIAQTAALVAGLNALAEASAKRPLAYWALTAGGLRVADETVLPHAALLASPIIVASQEVPSLSARLIDVPVSCAARDAEAAAFAETLAPEIAARNLRSQPLLAVRGRHLWVERQEPVEIDRKLIERGKARLRRASGPHVITGGLGRIGLTLADELLALGGSVVLLSRRAAPGAEFIRERFGDAAGRVEVLSCDVGDTPALTTHLQRIAANAGGLGGVFHCAGLADLRYLHETDKASIAAEAASKLTGTDSIAAALSTLSREHGVTADFVYLFSSLAAQLGGLGMSGYTAANRYLDAVVAQAPERDGTPWYAANFDDWDFDYTREQVGAFARTRSGLSLSAREGLDAIQAQLGASVLPQLIVSVTNLDARIEKWLTLKCHDDETARDAVSPARGDDGDITAFAAVEAGDLAQLVLKAYAKVIGSRDLELDADFFELGGDSLLAAQLAIELRAVLPRGTDVRIADVFDHPTPRLLARRLEASGRRIPATDVPAEAALTAAGQDKV